MARAFEMGLGVGVTVPREGETESVLERDLDGSDDGIWLQLSLRFSQVVYPCWILSPPLGNGRG